MEPPNTIFLKIEIRHAMRPVDLIFRVRYRRFDFGWSKTGGEGCERHPSGGFWPASQCRGMGRPRVGALGTSRVPLQRSSERFPRPAAPTMPPRAGSSKLMIRKNINRVSSVDFRGLLPEILFFDTPLAVTELLRRIEGRYSIS